MFHSYLQIDQAKNQQLYNKSIRFTSYPRHISSKEMEHILFSKAHGNASKVDHILQIKSS